MCSVVHGVVTFSCVISFVLILLVKREMACVLLLSEATDMRGFKLFYRQTALISRNHHIAFSQTLVCLWKCVWMLTMSLIAKQLSICMCSLKSNVHIFVDQKFSFGLTFYVFTRLSMRTNVIIWLHKVKRVFGYLLSFPSKTEKVIQLKKVILLSLSYLHCRIIWITSI